MWFGKCIFSFEYTCCEFRLWLTLEIIIAYLPLCTAGEVQSAQKAKPWPEDLGIKVLTPSVFTSVHCTEGKHAVFQHLLHLHPQAQPGWKQSKAGLKGDRIPVLITHVNALSIDSASADQSAQMLLLTHCNYLLSAITKSKVCLVLKGCSKDLML